MPLVQPVTRKAPEREFVCSFCMRRRGKSAFHSYGGYREGSPKCVFCHQAAQKRAEARRQKVGA